MVQAMFYERPVAINRDQHRRLKVANPPGRYRFAARVNALPITTVEFADAARHYPIVFSGGGETPVRPVVLVGLRDQENLMVNAAGDWETDQYIPACARRYPFVLAEGGADGQLTVCIDEAYPGLGLSAGEALFDLQGHHTPYLERNLKFLQSFHAEIRRTEEFALRLQELGLLVARSIHVDRPGMARQSLTGLSVIDSERLAALKDDAVIGLFRAGQLAWIQAHVASMGNAQRLATRLERRMSMSDETGPVADAPPAPGPVLH